MSEETFSSRAPSLPMPTIQNSIALAGLVQRRAVLRVELARAPAPGRGRASPRPARSWRASPRSSTRRARCRARPGARSPAGARHAARRRAAGRRPAGARRVRRCARASAAPRQPAQLVGIAAPHALHEAAVRGERARRLRRSLVRQRLVARGSVSSESGKASAHGTREALRGSARACARRARRTRIAVLDWLAPRASLPAHKCRAAPVSPSSHRPPS